MQQQSEKNSEFSERTEVLCRKIGVKISDLPPEIGVSHSMFHAYRSGKQPISAKVWRKLEAAERSAGIGQMEEPPSTDQKSAIHNPQSSISSEARLERLEVMLERIAGSLAEIARKLPERE